MNSCGSNFGRLDFPVMFGPQIRSSGQSDSPEAEGNVHMLTDLGCRQRRSRLWERIPDEIEWLLVGDARHVQYLSGFRVNPLSFSADQKGRTSMAE